MNKIARFVTRGTADGKVDLILGSAFFSQKVLKSNTIYEIQEAMGELVIVEKGPSALGSGITDSKLDVCWGNSVDHILHCVGAHSVLTVEEHETLNNKQKEQNNE